MTAPDRYLVATTDAVWTQYKLLFGHSETLQKEAELFLEEFSQEDTKEDVQTYLAKANDGVGVCNELCDQLNSQAPNLDLVNNKVLQAAESISRRLKPVQFPNPNYIDAVRTREMSKFSVAKQEQHSLYLDTLTQRKTALLIAFPDLNTARISQEV